MVLTRKKKANSKSKEVQRKIDSESEDTDGSNNKDKSISSEKVANDETSDGEEALIEKAVNKKSADEREQSDGSKKSESDSDSSKEKNNPFDDLCNEVNGTTTTTKKISQKQSAKNKSDSSDAESNHPSSKKSDNDSANESNHSSKELKEKSISIEDVCNEVNGNSSEQKETDKKEESKPPGLRLVPLNLLLRPDILNKNDKGSRDTRKPTRKSSIKARKSASFIEISSDEESEEQISLSSESSTVNSSDDEIVVRKTTTRSRRNDKKENSTKLLLQNGKYNSSLFKEPMSPAKLMERAKDLSINLEKMPDNVNKLMRCYRVDSFSSFSWSETEDFENMIETSKIDRNALDKAAESGSWEKNDQPANKSAGKRSSKKDSESESDSNVRKKSKKKRDSLDELPSKTRPKRNVLRKLLLDISESSNTDTEEDVPLKLLNNKKSPSHSSSKSQKNEDSSGSEDENKSKSNRSTRASSSKSKNENEKVLPEKRSTRTVNNLKITINLNKKKIVTHSEESEKSNSDGDTKKNKDPSPKQSSKSSKKTATEIESSSKGDKRTEEDLENIDEIPDEEKFPIIDQKLRTRNKYESHKDFNKLKEVINKRKSKKQDEHEGAKATKDEVVSTKNDKEKHSESGGSEKETEPIAEKSEKKSVVPKRKRIISSSDEEASSSKNKIEVELETPAKKKKKMDSSDNSDYNPSEDENKSQESEKMDNSGSSDEEITKKRKTKDEDVSLSEQDDEDLDELEKGRTKGKRRKRIKKVASSDEEGSDGEKKGKSGRKMIRKIMRADKLDVSTKEAAKIERERKQRIEDRQKHYNQFYDERPEEAKEITQLVLDFDDETKEPLLQVDKKLAKKLKPHQANGVKFMWDACFESLERCETEAGSGCILAHCMGLGKTLQVVTLVHTLLKNSDKTNIHRVLVVCPLSTVLNWVNEFNIWLKDIKGFEDIEVYEINKLKQNAERAFKLMEWHNDGGVMILSYDMFRNLSNDTGNRFRKKVKQSLQTSLVDPGPDLVICDEGHLLKNEKTSISKAMMKLKTYRRIVLTGTPLQNNLKEYYCMVQFVKPNLLGKYTEYMNRFVNPITNGQYTDSTEYDIQVMRRRAHVLHKLLDGCVQRRDYSVLAPFLPPKHEYVLSIKLTPMQVKLYKYYMENKSRQGDDGRKGSILFQDFQNLQRIWTAPLVLRYNSNRYEIEMQRRKELESEDESEGSLKDFIDDSESAVSTSSDESGSSDDGSIRSDEKKKKKKKKDKVVLPRRTRAMAATLPSDHEEEEIPQQQKKENPTEWWMQICPEEELNNIEHSSKLMLLMSILEKCEAIGDKLLVFSQSLYSLDVIEHFLNYIDEQTQQNAANASFTGSWTQGQDYFRLDGSTPVEQRNAFCKHFNDPNNPKARLFLISTRAGGLGINLVAANRVVIFDVSWNPSHDIQSIFRVYRFGQTKPCYIYRFLAYGTMEEKIYERQVTKQAISKRVIDEQQIDRHYNQNDLQELYKYDLEPDDDLKILPILPKDRLFAEMLQKFEDTIHKYHEHDTLLENKEEETLDEEERKQAWEEFEAEKKRPQFPAYYPQQQQQLRTGPVTSNNIFGIRTDVLLKLLSMKARLDNPTLNDQQVKHAIPLLMQELYRQMERGELTLYQQLLALSSSLEVPTSYGGQFQVNENLMLQAYNSFNTMPSTSNSASANLAYRQQIAERQQLANAQARLQRALEVNRRRSPPRIVGNVIEID